MDFPLLYGNRRRWWDWRNWRGELWIVFPSFVAIALLLLVFQQGFGFFNLLVKFSERVTNSIRRSFFYLSQLTLYFTVFVL